MAEEEEALSAAGTTEVVVEEDIRAAEALTTITIVLRGVAGAAPTTQGQIPAIRQVSGLVTARWSSECYPESRLSGPRGPDNRGL